MWAETSVRLFLAALVPLAAVIPLRVALFGDSSPLTVVLLGPGFEESLKLGAVILALTLASLTLRGGRDPEMALRYWFSLLPWVVGGLYGMAEGILVYPGEGGLDFTLREAAHGTFLALGLGAALWIWRQVDAPFFGIGFGFGSAFAAHIGFNLLALFSGSLDITFLDQAIYLAAVAAIAVATLVRGVRQEPASAEARAFLPARARGLHP